MSRDLSFEHLTLLTTPLGLYEHALGTVPRREHGYCVDDVARALVVTSRVPEPSAHVQRLAAGYLEFVLASLVGDGQMHNRRSTDGSWSDLPSSDDHWGRGLWALGTAAADAQDPVLAFRARTGAATALQARSSHPRAMAYATLGAGQLLHAVPDDAAALLLMADARRVLPRSRPDSAWPWPTQRLTYANAVLPEAMIVIGGALEDDSLREDGLLLLRWLVGKQLLDGHLSVVPSTGMSPGDSQPGYAQQPIEVAALAEAARTAYVATGDGHWTDTIDRCHAWFFGANDGGLTMCDPTTGGGFDGLERGSVNRNQGAESTLAWLSTAQIARMPQLAVAR